MRAGYTTGPRRAVANGAKGILGQQLESEIRSASASWRGYAISWRVRGFALSRVLALWKRGCSILSVPRYPQAAHRGNAESLSACISCHSRHTTKGQPGRSYIWMRELYGSFLGMKEFMSRDEL